MSVELKKQLPYLLRRLWYHIGVHRRMQFLALGVLMILAAIAEIISIGAIVPFLGVLAAPDAALMYSPIKLISEMFGGLSENLVAFFTCEFIGAAVVAGLLRLLLLWVTTRLAFSAGSDLSAELYRRTLYQPYMVHISRNSSSVLSGIGKVSLAINVLSQCLILTSSLILLLSITTALVLLDPIIASAPSIGNEGSIPSGRWLSKYAKTAIIITPKASKIYRGLPATKILLP